MFTFSASGVSSVTMPNPDNGNADQHNNRAKFMFSMNGGIYSFVEKPASLMKTLTFSNLSSFQAEAFMTFLIAASAKTVTINTGTTNWVGKIFQKEFTSTINNRKFGHSISVEFSMDVV